MEEKIIEEMNQPEWIQVDMNYMQKVEENIEYYKTAINLIKDELYGLEGLTKNYEETVKSIENIIKELEKELNWGVLWFIWN